MARYYKRYYRRYGKRYGYKKSSYSKRSYGNYRAAKQQADQTTFAINIPTRVEGVFCQEQNVNGNTFVAGTYALNIFDLLRKSEFYQNYAGMYDEFKVDNIKIKLLPHSFTNTTNTGTNYSNLTVYTAWDRSGLNDAQLKLIVDGQYTDEYIDDNHQEYGKKMDYIGKDGDNDGLYVTIGEDITTYSSAESRQVNPNSNSTITRWLKPKTIAEKGQWLSTQSLKAWYGDYDDGGFKLIPTGLASDIGTPAMLGNLTANPKTKAATLIKDSPANPGNPCFLLEDPSISFKPTLLISLFPKDDSDAAVPNIINFNVESEVVCTFRGLRKARVVGNDYNFGQYAVVIDKQFVEQNNGRIKINDVDIIDAVNTGVALVDVDIHMTEGDVETQINGKKLNEEEDDDMVFRDDVTLVPLRDEPYNYPYIVEETVNKASPNNELYNRVSATFKVSKFIAEHVILTKDGQLLSEEDIETVIENLDAFNTANGKVDDYQYYYLDSSVSNNKKGGETKAIPAALAELLAKVGGIVVTHINQSTTVIIGGRVRLEDKGYWYMKNGEEVTFVLNDYATNEVPEIQAKAGDTFFYFGAEIDSNWIGRYGFCCSVDSNYNVCWNNQIEFKTVETVHEAATYIIDKTKLAWNYISNKIWSFFSTKTVTPTNNNNNRSSVITTEEIQCSGFTFIPDVDELQEYLQQQMDLDL